MDFFRSDRDYCYCCSTIFSPLSIIVISAVICFILVLPMGDPKVECETKGSSESNDLIYYFACQAYYITAQLVKSTIDTLKCVMCVLFEQNCDTQVEEPCEAVEGPSGIKLDIAPKQKKCKPKKEKVSKTNSCPKCIQKGQVCSKSCSKVNVKKK